MEKSFRNCGTPRNSLTEFEVRSRQVVSALWQAFPEATSANDLSERAAPYFRDERSGQPINSKTIRLWLDGVSLPRTPHTLTLIGMVGANWFSLPLQGSRA